MQYFNVGLTSAMLSTSCFSHPCFVLGLLATPAGTQVELPFHSFQSTCSPGYDSLWCSNGLHALFLNIQLDTWLYRNAFGLKYQACQLLLSRLFCMTALSSLFIPLAFIVSQNLPNAILYLLSNH